jgi:hypothetical protein
MRPMVKGAACVAGLSMLSYALLFLAPVFGGRYVDYGDLALGKALMPYRFVSKGAGRDAPIWTFQNEGASITCRATFLKPKGENDISYYADAEDFLYPGGAEILVSDGPYLGWPIFEESQTALFDLGGGRKQWLATFQLTGKFLACDFEDEALDRLEFYHLADTFSEARGWWWLTRLWSMFWIGKLSFLGYILLARKLVR